MLALTDVISLQTHILFLLRMLIIFLKVHSMYLLQSKISLEKAWALIIWQHWGRRALHFAAGEIIVKTAVNTLDA